MSREKYVHAMIDVTPLWPYEMLFTFCIILERPLRLLYRDVKGFYIFHGKTYDVLFSLHVNDELGHYMHANNYHLAMSFKGNMLTHSSVQMVKWYLVLLRIFIIAQNKQINPSKQNSVILVAAMMIFICLSTTVCITAFLFPRLLQYCTVNQEAA